MRRRIDLLIAVPVMAAALVCGAAMYVLDARHSIRKLEADTLVSSHATLTQLQNILDTQLTEQNWEDARLNLSIVAMQPNFENLLLSNEQDVVVLAGRYILEAEPAANIDGYDQNLARSVREGRASRVWFSKQQDRLYGLYPVTLSILDHELGRSKVGTLFFEYSLAGQIRAAKRDALIESLLVGGLLMLAALAVSLLLRRLVSLRIAQLVDFTRRFSAGEVGARVQMDGVDEIGELARSFNEMARLREQYERELADKEAQRKDAYDLLQLNQYRLNEAQRMAHVGNWELDMRTGKLEWSDEVFRLFEIDKQKFGATYEAFLNAIHPDDRAMVSEAYSSSLVTRAAYQVTHRLLMQDGRIKWVEERGSSDFDADGKALRSIGTVQDVTRLHQIQDELEQLNRELEIRVEQRTLALKLAKEEAESANRSKSMFLASMSHELRTPLNAILGYAQLMKLRPELGEAVRGDAQEIEQAGKLVLALVSDILDLARIESGRIELQVEDVALSDVLAECDAQHLQARQRRGITLVGAESWQSYTVRSDRRRLLQVLNNLVSNAIKYNRDQGVVTLLASVPEPGWVRVAISDQGIGISPEQQDNLFKPFNRLGAEMSRVEGTGIGLVITKHLVEAMGGRIGVASTPGAGSTFWVMLPLVAAVAPIMNRG